MKTAAARAYKHAKHVSWRRVENEAVILDLDTSDYFSLNEIGVLAWERFGEGKSIDDVVAAVCRDYAVEETRARADIERLAQALLKKKLLEPR